LALIWFMVYLFFVRGRVFSLMCCERVEAFIPLARRYCFFYLSPTFFMFIPLLWLKRNIVMTLMVGVYAYVYSLVQGWDTWDWGLLFSLSFGLFKFHLLTSAKVT